MASARVPGKDPFAQLAKLAKEIQEKNGGASHLGGVYRTTKALSDQ